MNRKKRISVINEHPEYLALMVSLLSKEGYEVTAIPQHQNAFERIKASEPDLVVCDVIVDREAQGFALIDLLYLDPETRSIPFIICSPPTQHVQEIVPSLEAKGIKWLEKPFMIESLVRLIEGFDRSKT